MTRSKLNRKSTKTRIPSVKKTTPVFALQSSYALSGNRVNGYTERAYDMKRLFLQDARRLARRIGAILGQKGWEICDITTNPGGMAVGGDCYASYRHPKHEIGMFLTIYGSAVGGRTSDGVGIYLQRSTWNMPVEAHRTASFPPNRRGLNERNIDIDPSLNAEQIAEVLLNAMQKSTNRV